MLGTDQVVFHLNEADGHAEIAASLLWDVDNRKNEGPAFGTVKAASAQAHATLALYHLTAARGEVEE